jgi:hypothetical protein
LSQTIGTTAHTANPKKLATESNCRSGLSAVGLYLIWQFSLKSSLSLGLTTKT